MNFLRFNSLEGLTCMHAKLFQSCLTPCDPMDCSPPRCSVHGILQARILEWDAITFSRESSQPRDQTCVSYLWYQQAGSLPLALPHNSFITTPLAYSVAGLITSSFSTQCICLLLLIFPRPQVEFITLCYF